MTSDRARKLLGGYATNSLTEMERKALFEAALDDQELFDALQQEEALKELLAEPASRSEVQRALAEAPAARPSSAWRSRGWLWGGVAGTLAAAVLMIAVIRSNQPPKYQAARLAPPAAPAVREQPSPAPPSVPAPAQPKRRKLPPPPQPSTLAEPSAVVSPTPPAAAPRVQAFRQNDAAQVTGAIGGVAALKAPLLQYSIVKRDPAGAYSTLLNPITLQPGDAVRLTVFSPVEGRLSLYQLSPAGDWKRVFPGDDAGLPIGPQAAQTIPDAPILVTEMQQKFRLTLIPPERAPLTVDLSIGPGKIP